MTLQEQAVDLDTEDTQRGRFLTFLIDREIFGIEIRQVIEIIGIQPITGLPETPECIKGIINLRGKIIPVIDIRLKFKKESALYSDRTCIIVINIQEMLAGFIVDRVADVLTIGDENIDPPPGLKTGIKTAYMKGIGKTGNEVILLLDTERLFYDDTADLKELIGGITK